MRTEYHISSDEMNAALLRARRLRSEYLADMALRAVRRVKQTISQPAAEHRKLAKAAIEPIAGAHSRNRSTPNPLMVRGLSVS